MKQILLVLCVIFIFWILLQLDKTYITPIIFLVGVFLSKYIEKNKDKKEKEKENEKEKEKEKEIKGGCSITFADAHGLKLQDEIVAVIKLLQSEILNLQTNKNYINDIITTKIAELSKPNDPILKTMRRDVIDNKNIELTKIDWDIKYAEAVMKFLLEKLPEHIREDVLKK